MIIMIIIIIIRRRKIIIIITVNFTENSMWYTLQLMVATMCGRKHTPPYCTIQEDRLTDQR